MPCLPFFGFIDHSRARHISNKPVNRIFYPTIGFVALPRCGYLFVIWRDYAESKLILFVLEYFYFGTHF